MMIRRIILRQPHKFSTQTNTSQVFIIHGRDIGTRELRSPGSLKVWVFDQ